MMKLNGTDRTSMVKQQDLSKAEQDDQKLKRACKQFEGIFIASMLKESMDSESATGNDRKDSDSFKSLRELTIEMTGESLVSQENGGIGLWKDLYRGLKEEEASRKYNSQMSGAPRKISGGDGK